MGLEKCVNNKHGNCVQAHGGTSNYLKCTSCECRYFCSVHIFALFTFYKYVQLENYLENARKRQQHRKHKFKSMLNCQFS